MSYYTWETFDPELQRELSSLKDEVYNEARPMRDRQVPTWRRNDAFWIGMQRALYLSIARDVTTIHDLKEIPGFEDIGDGEDTERIINMYRAHGESIIAALSANVPYTIFLPADAQNPEDISTSKAYRKMADNIEIKEEATLKLVKALFHLYNHGIAFGYNVYHRDKKYGIIRRPQIDQKAVTVTRDACPICDAELDTIPASYIDQIDSQSENFNQDAGSPDRMQELLSRISNGSQPQGLQQSQGMLQVICPQCGQTVTPVEQTSQEQIPYIHGYDDTPKGRSLIDVYGPLHVTVPHFVRDLTYAGYLRLDTDLDIALVQDIYPGFEFPQPGKTETNRINERTGANQLFYNNSNITTATRIWFRPWMLNRIKDKRIVQVLKEQFPNGPYVVFINDKFAEVCDEALDDCWTATKSPVSEYIHAEPIGNSLVPIQIMTNDLVNLTMETIECGIAMNFADPQVVDFDAMNRTRARPGDFTAVKAVKNGIGLDSSFYSTKPATLSQEVEGFQQYLEQQGQFVLGSVPSIYGGTDVGGSKTLGEYQQSRTQALQRLSIPWKSIASWWGHVIYKACNLLRNNMLEDESYAKPVSKFDFVNVWIRQSELEGKIGDILIQNSEQIPVTWDQKRQFLMQMMQQSAQMPQMMQIIFHPENLEMVQELFGMTDLYLPGADDRIKQLREIFDMSNNGVPAQVDEFDNHSIHVDVCDAWLKSDVGQDAKQTNPQAYQMILQHRQQHTMAIQQVQMQQMQAQNPQQPEPQQNQSPVNAGDQQQHHVTINHSPKVSVHLPKIQPHPNMGSEGAQNG